MTPPHSETVVPAAKKRLIEDILSYRAETGASDDALEEKSEWLHSADLEAVQQQWMSVIGEWLHSRDDVFTLTRRPTRIESVEDFVRVTLPSVTAAFIEEAGAETVEEAYSNRLSLSDFDEQRKKAPSFEEIRDADLRKLLSITASQLGEKTLQEYVEANYGSVDVPYVVFVDAAEDESPWVEKVMGWRMSDEPVPYGFTTTVGV